MFFLCQQLHGTIRQLALTILFALLTLLAVSPAFAQGDRITFRLEPSPDSTSSKNSYFVYDSLASGTVVEDVVVIINTGETPLDLYLFPSDAITAENGGIAFATTHGENPQKTGTWLKLTESEITIQPGQPYLVPFTFTIPEGVTGEHVAGIVVQNAAESEENEGSFGFNLIQRAATTVLVTVTSGPDEAETIIQPKLEITQLVVDLSGQYQTIVAELHNTGNAGLKAEGSLTIRQNDTVIRELPIRLGYFLAGESLNKNTVLEESLEPGEYDVTLALAYEGGTAEQTTHLSLAEAEKADTEIVKNQKFIYKESEPAIPTEWLMIGGGLIVLLVVVVLFQSVIMMRTRKG